MRRLFAGSLCCVVTLLVATTALAQQSARIQDVRVGFPHGQIDFFQIGSWTPVVVDVEVNRAFEGWLKVGTNDGDGASTWFTPKAVFVDGQNERQRSFVTYIKTGGGGGEIRVQLLRKDGSQEAATEYQPYQRNTRGLDPAIKLIVAIGQPKGFDVAGLNDSADKDWRIAFQPDVRRLPELWFGYEGVDVVILPTGSDNMPVIRDLMRDDSRRTALAQWVQRGGHLIVSVSESHATVASDQAFPLQRLLPAEVSGTATALVDQLLDTERFVQSKVPNVQVGRFTTKPGQHVAAGEKRKPVELAKLSLRPTAWIRRSEANGAVPVIVEAPYGLGRVTLIAFDTDQGPFIEWDGRQHFWTALLELGKLDNPMGMNFGFRPEAESDLAVRLCDELEQFGEIPVIRFGWVAAFILAYILIVGPLDYFFLKKVVKRMELTWITFPAVVLVVSVGAYLVANKVKGSELRLNKLDLLDFDLRTQQMQGTTWFSIFSPRFQHYDVGLETVPLAGGNVAAPPAAEGLVLSWMGRPDSGMRGIRRSQSGGLFQRSYEFADNGRLLQGLPVQVWSVKVLTGRWQTPFEAGAPPIVNRLEQIPLSVKGSVTSKLPWKLKNARLLYRDRGWDLGDLDPGETVELTDNIEAAKLGDAHFAPNQRVLTYLHQMMFQRALAGGQRTNDSEYLKYLDQSHRLSQSSSEAILVGVVEEVNGDATMVNNSGAAGCKLSPFEPPLSGTMRQNTLVRVFLPVAVKGE